MDFNISYHTESFYIDEDGEFIYNNNNDQNNDKILKEYQDVLIRSEDFTFINTNGDEYCYTREYYDDINKLAGEEYLKNWELYRGIPNKPMLVSYYRNENVQRILYDKTQVDIDKPYEQYFYMNGNISFEYYYKRSSFNLPHYIKYYKNGCIKEKHFYSNNNSSTIKFRAHHIIPSVVKYNSSGIVICEEFYDNNNQCFKTIDY